jgi:interferon-induced GTP-binding protein Mx1
MEESSSTSLIDSEARPVFDLLDDLRALGIGDEFPIPQIAVIGDQSSGKSSVLESLSGIPFPRGVGLVTRCPTCISMHKVTDEHAGWSATIEVKRTGKNAGEEKAVDFKGVGAVNNPLLLSERISMLTEQLVQLNTNNSSFSTDIIQIRVESRDVPDLTLIDLPGIIRTTTVGQSQDVISQIDALLDYFMRQSKTIILAVIPANQDIATVDVLERAQRVDPMGSRTIGVLTKLDLVDQGAESETLSVVNNVRKPLALGYVIVKNRNQNQLNSGLSLDNALEDEENFFSTHSIWSHVPASQRGVKSLSKKLSKVLLHRAQEALPGMKKDLAAKLKETQGKLTKIGDSPIFSKDADRAKTCLHLLSRFGQALRQISEGDYRDSVSQTDSDLRIKYHLEILFENSKQNLTKAIPNFDSDEYTQYLSDILNELRGRELPGFLSARLLLTAVSCSIEEWRKELEETFSLAVDIYVRAARKLIFLIARQVSG